MTDVPPLCNSVTSSFVCMDSHSHLPPCCSQKINYPLRACSLPDAVQRVQQSIKASKKKADKKKADKKNKKKSTHSI